MKRFLVLLLFAGCSCASYPVPNAQLEVAALMHDFRIAARAQMFYNDRPECPAPEPCQDAKLALAVAQAHYDADAALVTANSERTRRALDRARVEVAEFVEAADALR